MNRKDSAWGASLLSHKSTSSALPIHKTTTTPAHDKLSLKAATASKPKPAPFDMTTPPISAYGSSHNSPTSSSKPSAGRSRGRVHSSKPSSHRTSFTVVDLSRPARHYRVRSPSYTAPSASGREIDDVLALHFRSCSLFTDPSYQSNSRLPSIATSQAPTPSQANVAPQPGDDGIEYSSIDEPSKLAPQETNTTMHWTSPSTRRREYERIDRSNRGIRKFLCMILPRRMTGPQEKFYEKNQSDTGSVRRYRIDDEEDDVLGEKGGFRAHTCAFEKVAVQSRKTKKSWICC